MIVDPAEYPPGLEERFPVTKLTVNQRKEPFSFSKTNARDQTFQNLYARYSSTITYLEEALFSGFCDRVFRKKFSKQDAVDLAKMVSIRSICIGKSRETEIIDLSKVPMIDEYRVEVFLASLQCFEEHKFNIVKNYGPNRLQNIDMLLEHISDSSLPLPNTTFYHHCYQKLIIYLRNSIKGLTDISDVLSDFSYKSLQAIFDELYIRKGRNEINMLRDVGSATFFLSSKSLLNQVLDTFNKDFNDNFNISDSFWTGEGGVSKNDISSILREFGRMKPLNPDAPFDERIYPFQIKRHNSHGTEKETDNSLHILHFFIGFPVCSFTTTMTVICAYELVIGVKDDIEEFKLARDNLERERILDQLPALENISNGVETNNNECKDTIEELNAYQSIMKSYGGIDCDLSYSQCDKIYCDEKFPWEEGNKDACPKITCLNSVRITTWTHNPEKNHRCVKLWENSLPQDLTNNRFQVKDCTVFADSYGEGGLFFISLIAKLHEASNTWVEIASRCIGPSEKENWTGSVCLVNERFSYSSCELGTFLPPNSISVALIACGAFSSWKQDLVYAGHKLILSYDNKKDYVESIDKKTGDISMEASQVEMNQEQDREEEDSGSESEIQSENSFAEEIENSTDRVVIGEGRKRNGVEEVVCNKIHQDEHTHNKIIESYVENAIQVDITCSGRLEIEKGKLMDDLDKNNVDDYDCEELNKKENSGMTEMEEQNNNVAREVKDCGDDKAETAENDRPGMMKEGKKISKGNLKKDEDSVSGNVEKNVGKVVKAQNGKKSSYENNIAFQIKNDNGGKGNFLECDGRVKVEDEVGIIDGIRKEREEGQENGGVIKVTVKGSKEDNNEMIENREEGGIDNCAKFDQNRAETNRKENDVISGKKDEEDSNEDGLANFTDVCIENSKNSKQENQERNISRKKKEKEEKKMNE